MLHVVLFVCGVVVGYAIATIWPISTSFEQCVLTMLAANQRKTWPSSFASNNSQTGSSNPSQSPNDAHVSGKRPHALDLDIPCLPALMILFGQRAKRLELLRGVWSRDKRAAGT
jgi:hypothetical protein